MQELKSILKKHKTKGNYDCIVPMSGGKDSTYVAHKLRNDLGLKPLTVTSRPPLETEIGKKNILLFFAIWMDAC